MQQSNAQLARIKLLYVVAGAKRQCLMGVHSYEVCLGYMYEVNKGAKLSGLLFINCARRWSTRYPIAACPHRNAQCDCSHGQAHSSKVRIRRAVTSVTESQAIAIIAW